MNKFDLIIDKYKEGRDRPLAGETDWLCAGKYCNLSVGKSSRAIIKKEDLKVVNDLAASAEKITCGAF